MVDISILTMTEEWHKSNVLSNEKMNYLWQTIANDKCRVEEEDDTYRCPTAVDITLLNDIHNVMKGAW